MSPSVEPRVNLKLQFVIKDAPVFLESDLLVFQNCLGFANLIKVSGNLELFYLSNLTNGAKENILNIMSQILKKHGKLCSINKAV